MSLEGRHRLSRWLLYIGAWTIEDESLARDGTNKLASVQLIMFHLAFV